LRYGFEFLVVGTCAEALAAIEVEDSMIGRSHRCGSAPSQSLRFRLRVSAASARCCIRLLIPSWRRASRRRFIILIFLRAGRKLQCAAKQSNNTAKGRHTKPYGKRHQPTSDIGHRSKDIGRSPAGHVVQGEQDHDNKTK